MDLNKDKPDWMYGIRLTPEPEYGRKGVIRMDSRVGPHVHDGWQRELKRDVFLAMENRAVVPNQFCMKAHQARVDIKPPSLNEPGLRDDRRHLKLPDNEPSVLVDQSGHIVAWVFPTFLSAAQLTYHNEFSLANAKTEFPETANARQKGTIPGAKTNGKARGGITTYKKDAKFMGTRTYALAWHERPLKLVRSFAPSWDVIICRTIQQAMQRDLFICSFRDIHWRLNLLLYLIHPQLYNILFSLRLALRFHPTCFKLLSIWESIFPGHSFICNRTTGRHIDHNGIRRGFEAVLAGGTHSGGSLYLKDINVSLPLLPGSLLFLDGTALRHDIEPWTGEERISNAFFVHQSVLTELEIDSTLPDLTIQSVEARLTAASNDDPSQPPGKRSAPHA